MVTDRDGNFKNAYSLDDKVYKQPEGIAFTPSGTLLISNESDKTGGADILVIKHKNQAE